LFRFQHPGAFDDAPEEFEDLMTLFEMVHDPIRTLTVSTRRMVDLLEIIGMPRTTRELRMFVLRVKVHKTSVENLSSMMQPINVALRRRVLRAGQLQGNEITAYNVIMEGLRDAPDLPPPRWDEPFQIRCRTTATDMNATLEQKDGHGSIAVIQHSSRSLTKEEQRDRHVIENECRTVIWALQVLNRYTREHRSSLIIEVKTSNPDIFKWLQERQPVEPTHMEWVTTFREYEQRGNTRYIQTPEVDPYRENAWAYGNPQHTHQ
jgi:hypothetical protein